MKNSVQIFGASVKGPSHIERGIPNQDAWMFRKFSFGSIVCVCDGLGSRKHSNVGSKMACEAVMEAVKIWVSNEKAQVNTLLQLIHAVWNIKIQPMTTYDCATTCLFTIKFTNNRCIMAQLGDGLILAETYAKRIIQVETVSEDFTNLTTGLGLAKSLSEWNVKEYFGDDSIQTILLCTDGISEDIAEKNRKDYLKYVVEKYTPLKGIYRWHAIVYDLKNWPTESHSDDKTIAVIYEDKV